MKTQLIFLSFFVVLVSSCNHTDQQVESNDVNQNSEQIIQEDTTSFSEEDLEFEISEKSFSMDDFPKVWIKLTCDEGGEDCYVNKSCELGVDKISIVTEKGENYSFIIADELSSQTWKLENFNAESKVMELYQVVEGSFDLIEVYGSDNRAVTFMWNRDLYFCNFTGLYKEPFSYFVPEIDIEYYEIRKEECEDIFE